MLEQLGRYVNAVLLIDVPDEEVIRRLSGRRVCAEAGHNYHVDFDPPAREDICDQDGSPLIQRDDDKPHVIEHRLAVYHEKTQPLVDYYDLQGVLRRIDGALKPAEVSDQINAAIRTLQSGGEV